MHRFYSSIINYNAELQSSLFGSKSTAQLVKFRFLLGGGCGVALWVTLPEGSRGLHKFTFRCCAVKGGAHLKRLSLHYATQFHFKCLKTSFSLSNSDNRCLND